MTVEHPNFTDTLIGQDRLRRALGSAVHSGAVKRLLELWPDASLEVRHFDSRYDGEPLRVTEIDIWDCRPDMEQAGRRSVRGRAECMVAYDQWDRRRGIDLAFRRALRRVAATNQTKEGGEK